jgi:hypothetical protein
MGFSPRPEPATKVENSWFHRYPSEHLFDYLRAEEVA